MKIAKGSFKSLIILIYFRPQLVIGIGGYASGPVLALAIILGRKTVIQEQNAYPGMTNRLLGRYVKLAFIPFSSSRNLFKNPIVTGNPIRKSITQAATEESADLSGKFTMAVVGGSQGSRILNKTVCDTLALISRHSVPVRIIHQTGKADYQWVASEYAKLPDIDAQVNEFIDDMAQLYEQSHLLFCRAGSMINEIIAMGRASILVPIAVSSGNHQLENAKTMTAAGAAVMIEENELNGARLFETIQTMVNNPDNFLSMGKNAKRLYQGNSAEKIVSAIFDQLQI